MVFKISSTTTTELNAKKKEGFAIYNLFSRHQLKIAKDFNNGGKIHHEVTNQPKEMMDKCSHIPREGNMKKIKTMNPRFEQAELHQKKREDNIQVNINKTRKYFSAQKFFADVNFLFRPNFKKKRKLSKKSNFKIEKIFFILLLFTSIKGDIHILDSEPAWELTQNRGELSDLSNIITIPLLNKIPTKEKEYLFYTASELKEGTGRNFLEIINFETKSAENINIDYFIHHLEFIDENSNRFVYHIQEATTSLSKFGYGTYDSEKKTLNFISTWQFDQIPYILNRKRSKTFAYSKSSRFFIFSRLLSHFIYEDYLVMAGDLEDESTWRKGVSPIRSYYPLEYYFAYPKKFHSTEFLVIINNPEDLIKYYDYSQNPLKSQKTLTMMDIFGFTSSLKPKKNLLYSFSKPIEESNYGAFTYHEGTLNPLKFTDFVLNLPEQRRTIEIESLNDSLDGLAIYGIKSTNFFLIEVGKADRDKILFIFNIYIIDNHDGKSDIEVAKVDEKIKKTKANWVFSDTASHYFQVSEYGEVLLTGYTTLNEFLMFTLQILDYVCHPTCGILRCIESGRKIACVDCSDPQNMEKEEHPIGIFKGHSCTCKSSHSFFELSSKKCIETCSKNEVVLADGIKYCLTDEECKGKNLYSTTNSEGKNICVTWRECAESGSYFDVVNEVCETDLNSKPSILSLEENSIKLGIDIKFCEEIKGMNYHQNICFECPQESPYFYHSEKSCLTKDSCENKSTDITTYITYDGVKSSLCLSIEECKTDQRFLFQKEKNICKATGTCKINEGDEENSCVSCPPEKLYYFSEENSCYSESECKAKSPENIIFTETDGTKECLTKITCKEKGTNYLVESDRKECILKSSCSKIINYSNQECSPTCNLFLDQTGGKCYDASQCILVSGDIYYPSVGEENEQNYCLTEQECKSKEGFLLKITPTEKNCIKEGSCDKKYTIENECRDDCPYFLNSEDKCLTGKECHGQGVEIFELELAQQKYCLTQEGCEKKAQFLFDADNKVCLKREECESSRFIVEEEGRCKNECDHYLHDETRQCFTGTECRAKNLLLLTVMMDGENKKKCISSEDCKNGNLFVRENSECLSSEQCKEAKLFLQEKECVSKCEKFFKNQVCLEKCPTSEEFGQINTGECVFEKDCRNIELKNGGIAVGKGNSETGNCIIEITPHAQNELYELNEDQKIMKLEYNPREKKIVDKKEKIALLLPFDMTYFQEKDRNDIIKDLEIQGNRRRVLQDQNQIEFELVVLTDNISQGYIIFDSPRDEKFKMKILFNTEKEFKNEAKFFFKLPISYITYTIPRKEINEPTDYWGIITFICDFYFRVISPFVGSQFHLFLSQNYQRTTLLSHLNFWKLSKSDWLYVKTFRDWVSWGGKLIIGEKILNEEIDKYCELERERNCFYRKNFGLLTAGFGSFIIIGVFLLFLLVVKLLEKKKKKKKETNDQNSKSKRISLYKIGAQLIFGLQTNLIFYTITSITTSSIGLASKLISTLLIFSILALLVIIPLKIKKINIYLKNMNRLLIYCGILYDIGLSVIINAFPTSSLTQTLILLIIQISYLSSMFPASKEKFFIPLLIQNCINLLQTMIMISTFLVKEEIEFWQVLVFLTSFLSISIPIFVSILIFRGEKNYGNDDENSSRDESKLNESTIIREKLRKVFFDGWDE